jgi:hypothetical protein
VAVSNAAMQRTRSEPEKGYDLGGGVVSVPASRGSAQRRAPLYSLRPMERTLDPVQDKLRSERSEPDTEEPREHDIAGSPEQLRELAGEQEGRGRCDCHMR